MNASESKVSVLFVCMGNICRSPTAEGVLRKLVLDAGLEHSVHVASAGTHAYHTGQSPDRRARAAAERRGYSLEGIAARRIADLDFEGFDFIVAMDLENLANLRELSAEEHRDKITLLLDYSATAQLREVPDPYYGGPAGFEKVLDLVEEASHGLLESIRARL